MFWILIRRSVLVKKSKWIKFRIMRVMLGVKSVNILSIRTLMDIFCRRILSVKWSKTMSQACNHATMMDQEPITFTKCNPQSACRTLTLTVHISVPASKRNQPGKSNNSTPHLNQMALTQRTLTKITTTNMKRAEAITKVRRTTRRPIHILSGIMKWVDWCSSRESCNWWNNASINWDLMWNFLKDPDLRTEGKMASRFLQPKRGINLL